MEVSQFIMIINSIITCGNNKFLIFYPIFFYFFRLPTSAKEDRNIGKWSNLLIRDVY